MSNLSLTTIVSGSTETTTYNNIADLKAYLNTVKTSGLASATISGELSESSDFSYLFARCPVLENIDLTELVTHSYINNLSHFVYNCPNLKSLDTGSHITGNYMNTENATDLSWAFAWNVTEECAKTFIDKFLSDNKVYEEFNIPEYIPLWYYSTPDQLKTSLITAFDSMSSLYKSEVLDKLYELNPDLAESLELPSSLSFSGHFNADAFATAAIGTASWTVGSESYSGEFGDVCIYDYCDATLAGEFDTINNAADSDGASIPYFYDDPITVFGRMDNMTSEVISDTVFGGLDTSEATNLQGMLYGCRFNNRGSKVDRLQLDTSKATDMSYMFAYVPIGCLYKTYYDTIDDYNTQYSYIQYGIDISAIDWRNVTDVSYMFEYCTRIKTNSSYYTENYSPLAFGYHVYGGGGNSNFTDCNFTKPVKMTGFMRGNFIRYFDLPSSAQITDASQMFKNVNVIDSSFTLRSKVEATIKIKSNFSENVSANQMFYKVGNYTNYSYSNAGLATTIDTTQMNLNWSNTVDFSEIFANSKYITIDVPDIQLSSSDIIDLSNMWTGQSKGDMSITNINILAGKSCIMTGAFCNSPLTAENFNLGETTFVGDTLDFTKLFYNAGWLTGDIYLSLVDTTKVISLVDFSTNCGATIHFGGTPDFNRVTSLENWGYGKTFDELHLEWFRNAEITNINSIFAGVWADSSKESLATVDDCIESLTTNIDLSHVASAQNLFNAFNQPVTECTMPNITLNLPALTNATSMFAGIAFTASTVITLTAPNLNMYSNMFNYCMFMPGVQVTFPSVPDKDIIRTWFSSCYFLDDNGPVALTGLIDSSVTSLNNMFYYCTFGASDSPISSIDFTNLGWDTSNVTDFSNMFYYASFYCDSINLTGLDFSSATNCYQMFRQGYSSSIPENINMGDFKAESEVDIHEMFYGYDNPDKFILSNNFNYSNITSWKNLGNVQFAALISAHVSELQSYDGMSFAGTWTYDTFVEEYVNTQHLFTVNSDHEIVIPARVKNIANLLRGSTLSEGSHDFVINAPGATDVSYLFSQCSCTNMIPRVIAPNAINYSYLYYNFNTSFPVNLAGGMVSTDETLTSDTLSPGTYYLYINIVNGLGSGELGENYVKLDPLTIGGQSVPFVHVKDFYYGLTKDDDSNIWRATGIRRTHTSVFSITLPESAQISFISHAPNALVLCQGSKNPKIDLSGINVSPDSDFINIYYSYPDFSSGVIEYDIHGLDLSEVEGTSNNVTDILGRNGCNCYYLNASNITLSDKITSLSNIYKASIQILEADLSGLSAPGVTTASSMFEDSRNIMCLNVSNWDVPALENLNSFCYQAINTTVINSHGTVDMSGWNAPNLKTMNYMFCQCNYMGDVKFNNMYDFDTSKVTDMSHMFQKCYALTTPNLTWIDLSSCTTIDYMFYDAIMGDLDVHFFDTSHIQSADYAFSYCRANTLNISEWDLSGINKALVDFLSRMPNCTTINMKDFFMPSFESVGNIFYRDTVLQTIIGPIHGESVTLIEKVFEECGLTTFTDDIFDFPNLRVISQLFSWSNVTSATFNQTYDNLQVIYWLDSGGTDKIETLNLSFVAPELVSLYKAFQSLKVSEIDLSQCTFSEKLCDLAYAFYGCDNLTTVTFPEISPVESFASIDSSVRSYTSYSYTNGESNFYRTFRGCTSLTSIDLSNIDFSNVKNLIEMFHGSGMTSNDFGVSSFPNVTKISQMFQDCSSIPSIDYSVWDMPSLVEASNVFAGCTPATTVGLTDFINNCKNTLTSISSVYGDATATTIQINDLELLNIIGMNTLLCYAPAMTRYEMENCNFPELTSFSTDTYNSIVSYSFSGTQMPKVTSFPKISSTALTSIDYSNCEFQSVSSLNFSGNTSLSSIDFSGTDLSGVTNASRAFQYCTSLTSLDLTLSNCTNLSQAFEGCTGLETLTLRGLRKVANFTFMCTRCTSLSSFTLDNCTSTEYSYRKDYFQMFSECNALTSVDLSSLDNSLEPTSVYCYSMDCNNMFLNCTNLSQVKLPSERYRSISSYGINVSSMFKGCTGLQSVDMHNFVFPQDSSITSVSSFTATSMFDGCTNITSVRLPDMALNRASLNSAFKNCAKLTSVTSGSTVTIESSALSAFEGCTKLVTVPAFDIISGTSKINVENMFKGCSSLTDLNLKWFKWDRISAANNMFVGDSALTTITCKEQTAPSTTYSDMFSGCTSLVGNAGTEFEKRYNASDISSAFAQSATGYFTTVPISFFFNGTECSGLFFNGTEIGSLFWNGTKVF